MEKKYHDSKFKEWLDILQQESWQLELIISGVAIFGLFQSLEPVARWMNHFQSLALDGFLLKTIGTLGLSSVLFSVVALIVCLLVHIVLRGLWIGAVGLRYFSGDIDYDHLRYTDTFKGYLKKRIGSFDDYIGRLEDYCSIIFAISFLLVFFFISFFLTLIVFIGISFTIDNLLGTYWIYNVIGPLWAIVTIVTLLFTAIDFFSQGFLKRKKWVGYIYFPIYRVMSRITFSFVYRPLLYNLLDNKMGKRIIAFLIPAFIFLAIAAGSGVNESNYHNDTWWYKGVYAHANNYEDQMENREYSFIKKASIPSRVVYKNSLPLFIKHQTQIEDAVFHRDSTLVPRDDIRGFDLFKGGLVQVDFGDDKEKDITDQEFDTYVQLLEKVIRVTVDDTFQMRTPFTLTRNFKRQQGYETVLDLQSFSRGLHTLKIERERSTDSLKRSTIAVIPFWYYPD